MVTYDINEENNCQETARNAAKKEEALTMSSRQEKV